MCVYEGGNIVRKAWNQGESEMGKYLHQNYKKWGDWSSKGDTTLWALKAKNFMEIAESPNCKNGILLDSLPHGMSEHQWAVDHIKEKYNYDLKVNFILNLEAD